MAAGSLLVYGAYGYAGELIARSAARAGRDPTLAGRRRDAVEPLGRELDLRAVAFRLDDVAAVEAALADHDAVLNCAGPFADTYEPLVEASLATGTDYLDLTGEIDVFEALHAMGERAAAAGVTLLPGVGFDVVATDCLAAFVADRQPDATELTLAFDARGPASDGTLRTTLRSVPEGGRIRRDGELTTVPHAWRTRTFDFGDGERKAATVPWGDVATALYTTGIPNTTVYMAMPPGRIAWLRRLRYVAPLLGVGPLRSLLEKVLAGGGDGPDPETREATEARVWAEAEGPDGSTTARLRTPNTYDFTTDAALAASQRVLQGDVDPGFTTPGAAFGPDFVLEVDGVERELVQ